ncbi:3,4-dihydroxy-2-butanone 4-phosphate synthase [candidate division MSBL1 archaeon SCGC-AAA261F19]|uniref:3,4-dihydroxy-2-butanone 4-phosphate synthase n=1 Tax=candidate division MSBL1 archaeon SCGC-AAA261F19 TaxID=1698275 RepID=A0A133VAM3_9EURY|nr:3,4-dihydroxy-2-butanone 4-phosphate synthase [candidate division MSBL1 archaeon SCGC-AAA261F19]
MKINRALDSIRNGEFVLVHDASEREDETDLVIAAEKVRPAHVAEMRRDGGGLICVALHPKAAKNLNLPLLTDIYKAASSAHEVLDAAAANDLPYDERSSFSISVNHRDTFTGVTDEDRALTISELGKLANQAFNGSAPTDFGRNFRTPGHVPLLRAAEGLTDERQGHTELSVVLMVMAGISPAAAICEMLDDETSRALSHQSAREYAEEGGLVYLEGDEIRDAFSDWRSVRK